MLSREQLALQLIDVLNRSGFPYIYLRNHEALPDDIGNDVDLLVPRNRRNEAATLLSSDLDGTGWHLFHEIEFGPISLHFTNTDSSSFLHVDLFDRLEWHWIPFAETVEIFSRKIWNGLVFHPLPEDEVFLNVMTRLGYAGIVRDKHRSQAETIVESFGKESVLEAWTRHMGNKASSLLGAKVVNGEWDTLLTTARTHRLALRMGLVLKRPRSSMLGLLRYASRSIMRIMNPPGPFIVLEGADCVGKSTVIQAIYPLLMDITGRDDLLLFHWKPCRESIQSKDEPAKPTRDPRLHPPRPFLPSLAFLAYHWLGFWTGWFRFVLPSRIKNRACLGDRYAWEFFLDPMRLRLKLPGWILRLAARTVPSPSMTIGLSADPFLVVTRKRELSPSVVATYQARMAQLSNSHSRWIIVDAGRNIEEVVASVKNAIASTACK